MLKSSTYFEWANLLEKFANGDDTKLTELQQMDFVVDAGTASRFYLKVEEAYKIRKKSWLEKLNKSLQSTNLRTDSEFELVLSNAKSNLQPLFRFTSLEGLPNDLKEVLQKDLEKFVNDIKDSLAKSISRYHTGREKVLLAISSFDFQVSQINKSSCESSKNLTEKQQTKRKIIF